MKRRLPVMVVSASSQSETNRDDRLTRSLSRRVLLVYWAVYLGSCGHVVVTPERIRFRSLLAWKTKTGTAAAATASTATTNPGGTGEVEHDQINVLDPVTGKCQVTEPQLQNAKVRTLVDVPLEDILVLRKTKSVSVGIWGIDGLEVKSNTGASLVFSSFAKRDEAFNRILALSPQNWK
jgi:hypothetical protein